MIVTVQQLESALHGIDQLINECHAKDIDFSYLVIAKEAVTNQLTMVKQSAAYQIEQFEDYGIPLDDEGADAVKALLEEIGYEQFKMAYGDSADGILAEVMGEEDLSYVE